MRPRDTPIRPCFCATEFSVNELEFVICAYLRMSSSCLVRSRAASLTNRGFVGVRRYQSLPCEYSPFIIQLLAARHTSHRFRKHAKRPLSVLTTDHHESMIYLFCRFQCAMCSVRLDNRIRPEIPNAVCACAAAIRSNGLSCLAPRRVARKQYVAVSTLIDGGGTAD